MPRSREIRPAFFQDEDLATLSRDHRLLFQALWTLADREGRLEDRPAWIKLYSFPFDADVQADDIDRMLTDLAANGGRFIARYQVGGKRYLLVTNFKKHQNVHPKEAASELPAPDDISDQKRQTVTYFVRCGTGGPIKIGKTKELLARLSNMQSGAPEKLELLCTVDGDIEAECHRRFASLRVNGEWFSPGTELLDFISGIVIAGKSREVQVSSLGLVEGNNFPPLPSEPSLPSGPSEPSGSSPPAGARDPGTPEPEDAPPPPPPGPASRMTGQQLLQLFGQVRSRVFPNTLPWHTARDARGDAGTFAAMLQSQGVALAEVEATMERALEHIRDGVAGWNREQHAKDPSFAFGAWKSGFHGLLEELRGRAPPVAPSREAKRAEQRRAAENWRPRDADQG